MIILPPIVKLKGIMLKNKLFHLQRNSKTMTKVILSDFLAGNYLENSKNVNVPQGWSKRCKQHIRMLKIQQILQLKTNYVKQVIHLAEVSAIWKAAQPLSKALMAMLFQKVQKPKGMWQKKSKMINPLYRVSSKKLRNIIAP